MSSDLLRTHGEVREHLEELARRMSDPRVVSDAREMKRLGREHARLEKLLGFMDAYEKAASEQREAKDILATSNDEELVELARSEIDKLTAAEQAAAEALKRALVPHDPADDKSAIVEIRAGTGGEEATLFAAELSRMYLKYAENVGFRTEILSTSRTNLGGVKEIVFLVAGAGAYGRLRFEGGVHRVQRVPVTEAAGRIHTSAVSVAVLPEAEEVEVEINPDDLRIDVFRSSGPGGQSVNTTDSAVRVTHLPTGIVVQCQDERSQLKNKAKALKVLYAKLLDRKRQEQEQEISAARRTMVSTGDRSAKVRTYNFPQGRVTDHRIGLTLHNLPEFLAGNIAEMIEALCVAETEERLKQSLAE